MSKHWYHTELNNELAEKFRVYIVEHGFNFEMSEAGSLVHITVSMTAEEQLETNKWLKNLSKEGAL